MKQKTSIIIGLVVVLLLLIVWLYLLFFDAPKTPADIWNNFNQNGEVDPTVTIPPPPKDEPVVNLNRPRLRQLTTKPVIGFMEVNYSTSTPPVIYYAEAGTGHIFTIDLVSGAEERISNTTLAEANYATFSPQGEYVALRSKNDRKANTFSWGKLSTTSNSLDLAVVDSQVYDFKIINNKELVYTERTTTGLTNYALDLNKKTKTELFTIPFFEATLEWGSTTAASHFAYPKATFALEGYLYEFSKKAMSRTSVSGFGLTAFNTPKYLIYNKLVNYEPKSYAYNKEKTTHHFIPLIMLPEKCVPSQKNVATVWCGYEPTELEVKFPDNWYRGLLSFKDTIWEIDLDSQTAASLVDTLAESGREIDITNMSIGSSESALYFINKNDNTLWMYEL